MNQKEVPLEKHLKYKPKYGKDELYWGIGIENEMYLEFERPITVSRKMFVENHKRERYSVDYYTSYKYPIQKYMSSLPLSTLPLLVNNHTFMYMDENEEHQTTYEKVPQPNKKFTCTIHDQLMRHPYYASHYNVDIVYDGDTIEFITQNFYKTTINKVINELIDIKKNFTEQILPIFPYQDKYGPISIMKNNHPFAVHLSNPKNVVMFNNGTYHINVTLPTKLNELGNIEDPERFILEHQKAIRLLQLFEPILIVVYGSGDPFSMYSEIFSPTSQRCAMSRYIGIGNYDSVTMPTGKILLQSSDTCTWYKKYHHSSGYQSSKKIGLDINFHKHHMHGIELRIFDYFPEEYLQQLFTFIVHLLDHSLECVEVGDITKTKEWIDLTINCLRNGKNTLLLSSHLSLFNDLFGTTYKQINVLAFYRIMTDFLDKTYGNRGKCSSYMFEKEEEKVHLPTSCCTVL